MALKNKVSRGELQAAFEKRARLIEKVIIQNLKFLGEQCVNQAREYGTYTDRTGNLRSSKGYVLAAHGKVVSQNFEEINGPEAGEKNGRSIGLTLANEIVSGFTDGYVLVVVAGMNYAVEVQSRGYDVLDSAEKLAERRLPVLMARIKERIDKSPI